MWAEAARLGIELAPLPGHSPDLMSAEALWRWLREDVTHHHGHATAGDLTRCVAAFEVRINQNPCTVADRFWVKDHLDIDQEKLWFSRWPILFTAWQGLGWRVSRKLLIVFTDWVSRPNATTIGARHTRHV